MANHEINPCEKCGADLGDYPSRLCGLCMAEDGPARCTECGRACDDDETGHETANGTICDNCAAAGDDEPQEPRFIGHGDAPDRMPCDDRHDRFGRLIQ